MTVSRKAGNVQRENSLYVCHVCFSLTRTIRPKKSQKENRKGNSDPFDSEEITHE